MARSERAEVSAGRGSVRATGEGCGTVRRNDGSTSRAAAFAGVAAFVGAARGEGAELCGLDGGAVCVAVGAGGCIGRAGAAALCEATGAGGEAGVGTGGAGRGGGAGLCGLGDGGIVCGAIGAGSRTMFAGGGAGCRAAGAGVERGGIVVASATVGVELAASAAVVGIALAVSATVLGDEFAGTAGFFAAARVVVLALTRARRTGAGLAAGEVSDGAAGAAVAVDFEGARRRTGTGVGGVASDAFSPVDATIGLRLRGAFGRSASSMR